MQPLALTNAVFHLAVRGAMDVSPMRAQYAVLTWRAAFVIYLFIDTPWLMHTRLDGEDGGVHMVRRVLPVPTVSSEEYALDNTAGAWLSRAV